jgi:hypothetical protein
MIQRESVSGAPPFWSALRGRFAAPQGEASNWGCAVQMFHVKQGDAPNEI